jgi:AcrR family transcriptional regulator
MQNSELSLRERNRIEAWETIHDAAATIALDDGPTVATVDLIAARAGVSRRTFFNYFASKEDAILGISDPALSDAALEAFNASTESLVVAATHLMAEIFRSAGPQGERAKRSITLIRQYPELRGRLGLHARSVIALATPVIAERILATRPDTEENTQLEAGAVAMLAGTILKFTYTHNLNGIVVGDTSALDDAITMFRKVATTAL